MLYSSTLLVFHLKYSSVHMSTPNSLTVHSPPLPTPPRLQATINSQVCESVSLLSVQLYLFFLDSTYKWSLAISFSDFLHSVWQFLDPFMLLQVLSPSSWWKSCQVFFWALLYRAFSPTFQLPLPVMRGHFHLANPDTGPRRFWTQ